MDTEIMDLIENMETRLGADQTQIDQLLGLGFQFPDDYIKFMKYSNGAEGPIGNQGYLSISSIEEVLSINEEHKSSNLEAQILFFASDGAGAWYAFRKGVFSAIVEVDLYDIDKDSIIFLASTLKDFLKFIANQTFDE